MSIRLKHVLTMALLMTLPGTARAQWATDGIPLSTAVGSQTFPTVAADGAGGAIAVWQDSSGGSWDIFVQRVDHHGTPLWGANGFAVCSAPGDQQVQQRVASQLQQVPAIVSDGAGGAIVTWRDRRSGNFDIYAQRVSPAGVPLWTSNGVPLSTAAGDQLDPTIAIDGSGGAIVTWRDGRLGSANLDIYAQRVNASGIAMWTANGVALSTAASDQQFPTIAPDGAGGAFVTWYDYRNSASDPKGDVYANHVTAGGTIAPGWGASGNAVCTVQDPGAGAQEYRSPVIAPDGAGGAIITWRDGRGSALDIYAQRMSSGGSALWTSQGVPVCTAASDQQLPQVAPDGTGGAFITWYDFRSEANGDMFIQRLSPSGSPLWTSNGVIVAAQPGDQRLPTIIADGAGGAIVTWVDGRYTTPPTFGGLADIFAQRFNSAGAAQWAANGVPICTQPANQAVPVLVGDGGNGAIIAWMDRRAGGWDIYAQRVAASGNAPAFNQAPVLDVIANQTINEGGTLSFTATASDPDQPFDALTFTLDAGAPSGASISSAGSFSWTTTEVDGPNSYSVTIRVADDGEPIQEDSQTISIQVNEMNQAPVLAPIGDQTVTEGQTLSWGASATDADLPSNTVTFTLDAGAPAGASITTAGVFTWTPSEAQAPGTHTVTVRVGDGGSPPLEDFETIAISVLEANAAPSLAGIGDQTVDEGSPLAFTASATDPDSPAQTLTFTLDAGAPAGSGITSAGSLTWTPAEAQGPGLYPVTVRVSDDGVPTADDSETFTIQVNDVNHAPALASIGDQTVTEGQVLSLTASATDDDYPVNTLSFSLDAGAPTGATITPAGAFSWTPSASQAPGAYVMTIRVADNGSPPLEGSETITVTVLELSPGSITGNVTASCPSPGTGLLGVTVDLFQAGTGDLVATTVTAPDGSYMLEEVPAGDYTVTVVTPLGYTAAVPEVELTLEAGAASAAEFALTCQAIVAQPRGTGYWKHQVGVATGGRGNAQVSGATLCQYLDLVHQHFNSNQINEVNVYVQPASGNCADKLQVAKVLLNLPGSSSTISRARQQLMALLLNVAGGYIGLMESISHDGATVSQAITYCDNLIDDAQGDHELAKTIAGLVNDGQIVPSGVIPLSTANIAYRGVLSFRVAENPAFGIRTFSLALGSEQRVSLAVFDAAGRRVALVHDGLLPAGTHTLRWDGLSRGRRPAAQGLYFARLVDARGARAIKFVQLRH